MDIRFEAEADESDIEAVIAILGAAAEAARPGADYQPFAFFLRDADGSIQGGLSGVTLYEWMHVQYLAVAEQARGGGWGAKLMDEAERWGRKRGLKGMWLDTFEFQVPDFYRKLGFVDFGIIENHPEGSRRIFFKKQF